MLFRKKSSNSLSKINIWFYERELLHVSQIWAASKCHRAYTLITLYFKSNMSYSCYSVSTNPNYIHTIQSNTIQQYCCGVYWNTYINNFRIAHAVKPFFTFNCIFTDYRGVTDFHFSFRNSVDMAFIRRYV